MYVIQYLPPTHCLDVVKPLCLLLLVLVYCTLNLLDAFENASI